MVIKYRWRMISGVALLWSASALMTGYFVLQAYQGARGIEAKREVKSHVLALRSQLSDLKEERATMEREIAVLRGPVIDGDLLDERVRAELGRVDKNDLVVFINSATPAK